MRHIPEDELHAYLDQGLSRTQCVEIESHLADCRACRTERDRIAALRDRTTALLARLAPPRRLPPPYESLRRLAAEQASQRRRRLHVAAWAASLVGALGLGWTASSIITSADRPGAVAAPASVIPAPAPQAVAVEDAAEPAPNPAEAPTVEPATPPAAAVARSEPRKNDPPAARPRPRPPAARPAPAQNAARRDSIRAAMLAVLDPSPPVELEGSRPDAEEFDGLWRTVSWDGARAEAGERLPHIDGLPVLKVQVQAAEPGKRSVMVVAQQLASGEVIQTIEGPVSDVSELLARRGATDVDSVVLTGEPGAGTGDHTMAIQLGGGRMLAITGALPSDSLRAMIRRLNAELRAK